MQKIKYIIIFTLLVALGMIYIQLVDYKNIAISLVNENTTINKNTNLLNNKLNSLQIENEKLKNTILSLEETLLDMQIKLNNVRYYRTTDINDTNNTYNAPYDDLDTNQTEELNIKPSLDLDDENKITGFGLEYTQEF